VKLLGYSVSTWIGSIAAVAGISVILFLLLVWPKADDNKKDKKREVPAVEEFETKPVYDNTGGEWRRDVPDLDWLRKG
jgi:hypothetical protein